MVLELLTQEALEGLEKAHIMLLPGRYTIPQGTDTKPLVLSRKVYIEITNPETSAMISGEILDLPFWKDPTPSKYKEQIERIRSIFTPALEKVVGIKDKGYTNNDIFSTFIEGALEHPECDLSDHGLVVTIQALLHYASLISPEMDSKPGKGRDIVQVGKLIPESHECLTSM